MSKNFLTILIVGVIAVTSVTAFVLYHKKDTSSQVACTAEAKICPDGTSVYRVGPKCEFKDCPVSSSASTSTPIKPVSKKGFAVGYVTLSPNCPVESIDNKDVCGEKPFSSLVDISGAHNFNIELHTDTNGKFYATLPVGIYTFMIHINALYPACESKTVLIEGGVISNINIHCDTGIR
jgi:hypothetical protein